MALIHYHYLANMNAVVGYKLGIVGVGECE